MQRSATWDGGGGERPKQIKSQLKAQGWQLLGVFPKAQLLV